MRLLSVLAVVVIAACGGAPAPKPLPPTTEAAAAIKPCTAQRRVDPAATRAHPSAFVGPTRPHARWVHQIHGSPPSGVTIDADANLYVASLGGVLALDRDGAELWHHVATLEPQTLAALAPDGGMYLELLNTTFDSIDWNVVGPGGLQRVDACGQATWFIHAPPQNGKTPTIGPDNLVYFAGHDRSFERPEQLEVARPDGTLAWIHVIDHGDSVTTPIAVADDGTAYYGTYKGAVVALDRAGVVRWTTSVTTTVVQSVTLGADGSLYATFGDSLVALDAHGHRAWEQTARGQFAAPVVGADGTLYTGGSELSAFHPDGTRAWHVDLEGFVRPPVVARDGTLFVGSIGGTNVGRLYAIGPGGDVRWMYYLDPPSSVVLAADGVLYVAAGSRVYAIGECDQDACEDDGSALATHDTPAPPTVDTVTNQPAKPLPAVRVAHDGYTIYPGCRPDTTAIVSSAGAEVAWLASWNETAKSTAVREQFRREALGAARIASHSSGFGVACVERAAFLIMIEPREAAKLSDAAIRVGEWLALTGVRGEVDIEISDMAHNM